MIIWIDADGCPGAIKEIVYRASERLQVAVCLVANSRMVIPSSARISAVRVGEGVDMADRHIIAAVAPEDLVVTADVPLAAEVVAKGAVAISPRGKIYTGGNVRVRLSAESFLANVRAVGPAEEKPGPLSAADRQRFASALDRVLTKRVRDEGERASGGAPTPTQP